VSLNTFWGASQSARKYSLGHFNQTAPSRSRELFLSLSCKVRHVSSKIFFSISQLGKSYFPLNAGRWSGRTGGPAHQHVLYVGFPLVFLVCASFWVFFGFLAFCCSSHGFFALLFFLLVFSWFYNFDIITNLKFDLFKFERFSNLNNFKFEHLRIEKFQNLNICLKSEYFSK
jgi:hypothetical protein